MNLNIPGSPEANRKRVGGPGVISHPAANMPQNKIFSVRIETADMLQETILVITFIQHLILAFLEPLFPEPDDVVRDLEQELCCGGLRLWIPGMVEVPIPLDRIE